MIIEKVLLDYIKAEAIKAEGVQEALESGSRTWEECEQYIVSSLYAQVKDNKVKANGCSFAASSGRDEELVSMAIHYFTEEQLEEWDNIFSKPKKVAEVAGPSADDSQMTMFDEEELGPKANVQKVVKHSSPKPKKANPYDNPNQLTLF